MRNMLGYVKYIPPNALTLSRVAGSAHVVWMSMNGYDMLTIALVFAAYALTDAFDGPVARWLGAESNTGRIIDPIADKLQFWAGVYVIDQGIGIHIYTWIPLIAVAAYDASVILLRIVAWILWFWGRSIGIPSSDLGKKKTVLLMIGIVLWCLDFDSDLVILTRAAGIVAICIAALMSVHIIRQYWLKYRAYLRLLVPIAFGKKKEVA